MSELNIVDLIENNPIIRLTNTYQNKLLSKIKDNFNDTEQQLFISSFYLGFYFLIIFYSEFLWIILG